MLEQHKTGADITYTDHALERIKYWNLDFEKIEETIKTGIIVKDKSNSVNKQYLKRYFGKENITYLVVVTYYKYLIEVQTAWPIQGR